MKKYWKKNSLKFYDYDSSIVSDIFLIADVKDKGVIVSKNEKNHLIMFENIISAKIKVSFD